MRPLLSLPVRLLLATTILAGCQTTGAPPVSATTTSGTAKASAAAPASGKAVISAKVSP